MLDFSYQRLLNGGSMGASGTWGGTLDQNVFRVNLSWIEDEQHCQTGFFLRDVAVNDNDCESVANAVQDWVDNHFKTLLLNTDLLDKIDVFELGTENGFTHTYVNVTGTKAVAGVAPLPTFVAAQIALKTQRRKRYGQGRMFWPVRDENDVTKSSLIPAAVTAFQGVIDDLLSNFTGLTADLHLCAVHGVIPPKAATSTSPARPEIPPHWYDIDAVTLKTAVTSLRSRKVGVGT